MATMAAIENLCLEIKILYSKYDTLAESFT